jgi:dephospho-CoA kinase
MKPPGIYLIGLTGGIACGKSVVVDMLEELGAHTLDADAVTRRLQEPGQDVYELIVRLFGEEVLQHPDGPLDRAKIGARVFGNPQELKRLEDIVHPAVRHEVGYWLSKLALEHARNPANEQPRPVAVVDAIKLLESTWVDACDAIWVVTCAPEQQIERLVQRRGMDEAEARRRIDAQPPQESRLPRADVVIDNSGTLDQTRAQVAQAWQQVTAAVKS